jgi:hypothetical protein
MFFMCKLHPSHSEAISYVTGGSQTNVLETCSTAIIRFNAVQTPLVRTCVCIRVARSCTRVCMRVHAHVCVRVRG